MKDQKILITSALPYANGPLHFGHIAGAYLPGDCYARFQRLQGRDVLYVCGSDEFGVAITLSAELANRTPQEQVDLYHAVNCKLFEQLHFSFDHYSRTTWEGHIKPVQQVFLDLLENGYIEERVTDQLYSEELGRFLADRYVTGTCPSCGFDQARGDECPECGASYEATDLLKPRCKLDGSALTKRATKHWFLLLEKFKRPLEQWIEGKKWKPNVMNFIKGYIEKLHARAITRDSDWGVPIPLPHTQGKVLYVWFDAPIGYISATMEWALKEGDPELWKKYWFDQETKLVHFIGKDNIPFHAAIFPAMIMGQNRPYKLVDEIPANEFFKLEGRQFSKSEGWYIDLEDFFSKYSSDQIRYAIAANAPETSDAEFSWKDFQLRCNTELAGKFGNLANRTLVFAKRFCDGVIPKPVAWEEEDLNFLEEVKAKAQEASRAYDQYKVRRASQILMELSQLGNVYFDHKKPWVDAKEGNREGVFRTIAALLECLKALALIAFPIIPVSADRLWRLLGFEGGIEEQLWDQALERALPEGRKLPQPEILFEKIEDEQVEQEIARLKKGS